MDFLDLCPVLSLSVNQEACNKWFYASRGPQMYLVYDVSGTLNYNAVIPTTLSQNQMLQKKGRGISASVCSKCNERRYYQAPLIVLLFQKNNSFYKIVSWSYVIVVYFNTIMTLKTIHYFIVFCSNLATWRHYHRNQNWHKEMFFLFLFSQFLLSCVCMVLPSTKQNLNLVAHVHRNTSFFTEISKRICTLSEHSSSLLECFHIIRNNLLCCECAAG